MPEMQRRTLLKAAAVLPLVSCSAAPARAVAVQQPVRPVRPGEPGWPDPAEWAKLGKSVGGRLVKVNSPFAVCTPDPGSAACADLFQNLRDPYYIDDSVALTQTLGWTDAWTSAPSTYAVLADSSADVAAAVNFAREHRSPPRRERGRSQLSRSLERTGFAAHLDQAQHAGHRAPRRFRAPGRRRPGRARDRRERRRRRDLDGCLQCGHHHRGPLCPGRGLHDRRCRPAWCRAVVSAASRRVSAPPPRTCWRRRSSPRTGPYASPTRSRTLTCSGPSRAAAAGPSASSPG